MKIELEISDEMHKFLGENHAVPVKFAAPQKGDYFIGSETRNIQQASRDWTNPHVRLIVEITEPFDLNSIVPDGWRAVGVRQVKEGEWWLQLGSTVPYIWNFSDSSHDGYIVVEPVDE